MVHGYALGVFCIAGSRAVGRLAVLLVALSLGSCRGTDETTSTTVTVTLPGSTVSSLTKSPATPPTVPSTTPTSTSTTTIPPPTTTTTIPPPPPLPPGLAAQVEELIAITESLRGQQFLSAPIIEAVTSEEVIARRLQGLEEDLDRQDLMSEAAFLALFQILPEGTDLYQFYIEFFSAGTLAYYDLDDQRLIVPLAAEELNEYEKWILVHELTHALMDQHNPEVADTYQAAAEDGDFDEAGALVGLLEGEAVLIQSLYLESLGAEQRAEVVALANERSNPTFGAAPAFFRDMLRFPYTAGSLFAVDLYRRGGVEALSQAFDRPPETTEQVFHPDRYVEFEVALDTAPFSIELEGYEVSEEGTWGERGWRVLLDHHIGASVAAAAADGWGGDHYQILWNSESGEVAFVVKYLADSFGDASELAGALGRFIEAGMRVDESEVVGTSIVWIGESYAYLAREGNGLTLVAASDPVAGMAIVAQISGD